MNTADRLTQYYDFSPEVLNAVSTAAEEQNTHTFDELATRYGVEDGVQRFYDGLHGFTPHPVEYVLFKPEADYDERHMRVLHLPMACPADKNMVMRGIRLFGADPTSQLMIVGNPSSPGLSQTKFSIHEAYQVFRTHSLKPAARPLLHFLEKKGVTTTEHLGFSYGASKGADASAESGEYGQEVVAGVFVDPANVVNRGLFRLFRDMMASNAELEEYVKQTGCEALFEARSVNNKFTDALWLTSLLRVSNLAVANVLKRDGFEDSVDNALTAQQNMYAALGSGTLSLIAIDENMRGLTTRLHDKFDDRVKPMVFDGMPHAGGDDIDLHAAMMLEGLWVK